MKQTFFITLLFTLSFLQSGDFGTLFMSTTLFLLLLTLVIMLMNYLKNLQRENQRYRTFFHRAQTAALFIDTKDTIRDLNESALTLCGYTNDQLTARKWYEALLSESSALQVMQHIRSSDQSDTIEFNASLIRADGDAVETTFSLSKLPDPLRGSILILTSALRKSTLSG